MKLSKDVHQIARIEQFPSLCGEVDMILFVVSSTNMQYILQSGQSGRVVQGCK